MVLRQGPSEVEVLLAERAVVAGDRWSGHLAFPGGLAAASDGGPLATAVRETREETGLDLSSAARPIGALSEIVTASHGSLAPLVIAPWVFALVQAAELSLSAELTRAHWVGLDGLAERRRGASRLGRALGWFLQGRGVPVAGTRLWGLTLAFLDELAGLE
ncbi:MAG: NUDIX domain-containing protein [Myxococcales bacterium]|nr:NUDIX domain-containing protein [Myxococcales bacterium]